MNELTILVPTFNESDNVEQLIKEIEAVTGTINADVLFVDDSHDLETVNEIHRVSQICSIPVRCIHRKGEQRIGGLSGAVTHGMRHAQGRFILVMDGDLQHPPALIPELLLTAMSGDIAIASRYCGDGDAAGLDGGVRRLVSSGSTLLARWAFPRSVGARTTDPMTGFFCVRRSALHLGGMHPRGFKILLEILVSHPKLRATEVSFTFRERFAGESKASLANGLQFLAQLLDLRIPRAARFALVGATGVVVNLAVLLLLLLTGMNAVVASVLATGVAMCSNFGLQERTVFHDLRLHAKNQLAERFGKTLLASALVEVVRVPAFIGLHHVWPVLVAQAVTVVAAAALRYKLTHRVYRPETVVVIPSPSPAPALQAEMEIA